jgi:hypothetical protein
MLDPQTVNFSASLAMTKDGTHPIKEKPPVSETSAFNLFIILSLVYSNNLFQ